MVGCKFNSDDAHSPKGFVRRKEVGQYIATPFLLFLSLYSPSNNKITFHSNKHKQTSTKASSFYQTHTNPIQTIKSHSATPSQWEPSYHASNLSARPSAPASWPSLTASPPSCKQSWEPLPPFSTSSSLVSPAVVAVAVDAEARRVMSSAPIYCFPSQYHMSRMKHTLCCVVRVVEGMGDGLGEERGGEEIGGGDE